MINAYIFVDNIEWECEDNSDHPHPETLDARIELPDDFPVEDQLALDAALRDGLIFQCNCCVIEADIQVLALGARVG